MFRSSGLSAIAAGLLLLAGLGAAAKADALDRRLLGAWTTSVADCPKLFAKAGENISFRKPIDEFAQAFIILPNRAIAPGGECSIASVSTSEKVTKFQLNCQNSIGYLTQTVRIEFRSDTEISYDISDDPVLAQLYDKCQF